MALCQRGSTVVVECDVPECDCEVAMDAQDVRDAREFAEGVRCKCPH